MLEWLHMAGQYLRAAGLENHEMRVWHITSYLADEAATWWRLHCANIDNGAARPITTWAELKVEMLARFSEINRITAVRDKYTSLRQTASVGEYINRFRELVVELPDESEQQQVYQCLKGLKSGVQRMVRTHKPQTVEVAMDIADEAERAHYLSHRGGFNYDSGSAAATEGAAYNGPAPMQRGALMLSPEDRERCQREGLCFACMKPGHAAREYPRRNRHRQEGGRRDAVDEDDF